MQIGADLLARIIHMIVEIRYRFYQIVVDGGVGSQWEREIAIVIVIIIIVVVREFAIISFYDILDMFQYRLNRGWMRNTQFRYLREENQYSNSSNQLYIEDK